MSDLSPSQAIEQLIADQATFHALVTGYRPWNVIAHEVHQYNHTGDLVETQVGPSITVPGGSMGLNGLLRITALWTMTNNANDKTPRVRFGGMAGTVFFAKSYASVLALRHQLIIANVDDEAQQAGQPLTLEGFGAVTGALVTPNIDTSDDQDIVFTADLANAGDTLSLREYLVERCFMP